MELWELNNSLDQSLIFKSYDEAKRILEQNGFSVITPFKAKSVFLSIVQDKDTAHKVNMYVQGQDEHIDGIVSTLNKYVLKESRGGSKSFETLKSYMDWRSKCYYEWYYNDGSPKK